MKYIRERISATVTAAAFVAGLCFAGAIERGGEVAGNLIGCVCCLGAAAVAGYMGGWMQ